MKEPPWANIKLISLKDKTKAKAPDNVQCVYP